MRLGWFTCSPLFAERLERIGETSTRSPCGFGQALAFALLSQYTFDGDVRWLCGLHTRSKFWYDFIDCLADLFPTPADDHTITTIGTTVTAFSAWRVAVRTRRRRAAGVLRTADRGHVRLGGTVPRERPR